MDAVVESFMGTTCHQSLISVSQHLNVVSSNDVTKNYSVNVTAIELIFSSPAVSIYTCSPTIEPNTIYDVM